MRVESENSETDLAKRYAMQAVEDRLRELAVNILRVTRGAGRSYEIGRQAQAMIDAMISYREAIGHWPSSEDLDAALDIEVPSEMRDRMNETGLEVSYATQAVINGALQIAASRLVGQRPQEAAGETEMHRGIADLEKAREQRRKEYFDRRNANAPSHGAPTGFRRK